MQKLEQYKSNYEIKLSGDSFKHVLENLKENEKIGYKWRHFDEGRYHKIIGGLGKTLKFNLTYDWISHTLSVEINADISSNLEAKEVSEIEDFIKQLQKVSKVEDAVEKFPF